MTSSLSELAFFAFFTRGTSGYRADDTAIGAGGRGSFHKCGYVEYCV